MSRLPKQTKRRDLIRTLRKIGFAGPYSGTGKHPEFMVRASDGLTVGLPNEHRGDIGERLLKRVLINGGLTVDEYVAAL